jgi:predicted lactoylglutathione lyase
MTSRSIKALRFTTATHVAFDAADRARVDAFFEAALANGATSRGEPGVSTEYSERYYPAFVNDLHGNNGEAVWQSPEPVKDAPIRTGVP